ncbi:hypothetical protein BASA81_003648 [Batrachochytrium salamandrivorans]|nr:hypothetical protein BASA81_003648 [Batrachochytrium salamandrivorans]
MADADEFRNDDEEDVFFDNLKEDEYEKYEQSHPKSGEMSALLAKRVNLSHKSANEVRMSEDKRQGGKDRTSQGRDDRATTEQVMDPRTRMILFKMLNRGVFEEIHGCVSTGKEANVYHATASGMATSMMLTEIAVKVFKTSVLVFRDRDKYVNGDHRFRGGYSRSNPRKMVRMWAEKELKNLNRLQQAEIPSPVPICLRGNVLVMEFLGENGWPAPRLKDALLDDDKMRAMYLQTVRLMRIMYHSCKLVHGDLSEYNMLYHKRRVYIIDVSQSVELDHPRALEFLRTDCVNVTRFFKQKLSNTLSPRVLFDFITDMGFGLQETEMDDQLHEYSLLAVDLQSDQVFMESFVPKTLHQVDFEELQKHGDNMELVREAVIKMTTADKPRVVVRTEESDDDGGEEEDDDDGEEEGAEPKPEQYKKSMSSKEERKLHKTLVKEGNAERRKHKLKKKDKKLHRIPVGFEKHKA